LSSSLTVAGDPNQWVYGSFGATPKLITDFEDLFSSPVPATKVTLTESFRSPQTIVDAGYNLVQNLSLGANRSPKSIFTPKGEHQTIRIIGDDQEQLQSICQSAAADGYKVLILIDSDVDKAWVDTAVGGRIRDDRTSGVRSIRVRSFHKAKSLEADIVVMVGDPSAGVSSWYRNQLFKLAGFSSGGDSAPGDTVYHGEALRLAHVAITRARLKCFWFPNRGVDTVRTASVLGGLMPGLFDDGRRA
jgi:superfamily I DNA/RNA helicase